MLAFVLNHTPADQKVNDMTLKTRSIKFLFHIVVKRQGANLTDFYQDFLLELSRSMGPDLRCQKQGMRQLTIQAETVCLIYLLTVFGLSHTWRWSIQQKAGLSLPLYQNIWGEKIDCLLCDYSFMLTKLSHAENDSIAIALRKICGHIGNQKKFLKAAPLLRQLFAEEKLSGAHGDLAFEVIKNTFLSAIFSNPDLVSSARLLLTKLFPNDFVSNEWATASYGLKETREDGLKRSSQKCTCSTGTYHLWQISAQTNNERLLFRASSIL